MKRFRDLKKGDRIVITYPETNSIFVEAVQFVETGEDGFVGSDKFFIRIHTNHESQTAGREILQQEWPMHWPISIPLSSGTANDTNNYCFDAAKDVKGIVSVADRADIDVICPPSEYDNL